MSDYLEHDDPDVHEGRCHKCGAYYRRNLSWVHRGTAAEERIFVQVSSCIKDYCSYRCLPGRLRERLEMLTHRLPQELELDLFERSHDEETLTLVAAGLGPVNKVKLGGTHGLINQENSSGQVCSTRAGGSSTRKRKHSARRRSSVSRSRSWVPGQSEPGEARSYHSA